jgi:hypothetical protein
MFWNPAAIFRELRQRFTSQSAIIYVLLIVIRLIKNLLLKYTKCIKLILSILQYSDNTLIISRLGSCQYSDVMH